MQYNLPRHPFTIFKAYLETQMTFFAKRAKLILTFYNKQLI